MRADTAQRLENAFEEAIDQLLAGEAAEADRRAKALSALVRARRDISDLVAALAPPPEEDVQELRAELRRRVARFVDAAQAGAADHVLDAIAAGKSAP